MLSVHWHYLMGFGNAVACSL